MKMIVEKKGGNIQSGDYKINNICQSGGVLSGGKSSLFQRLNDLTVPVGLHMMQNHVTDRINKNHKRHIHDKPIDNKMFENLIDLNRKDKRTKNNKIKQKTRKGGSKNKKEANKKKGTKKQK